MELSIKFVGTEPNEQVPNIALYQVEASGQISRKISSAKDGKLNISTEVGKQSQDVVALGPDVEDIHKLEPKSLMHLRVADQLRTWQTNKEIAVPSLWWRQWLFWTVCVSGKVSKCFPFWFDLATVKTQALRKAAIRPFPEFCSPICNGVVEVWEDTCCCWPIFVIDVPIIIAKLQKLLEEDPLKFPPRPIPGPDPGPIDRVTLDKVQRALALGRTDFKFTPNTDLHRHLATLQSLSTEEALQYIQVNPVLWRFWCTCNAYKLGETPLNPDGTFNFCWEQFPFLLFNCRRSYFYKVKQWQSGQWVCIYDGAAAYQYFNADDFASLSTFLGQSCGQPPPPDGTDFATLQQIGSTPAYQLHSHYNGASMGGIDLTQTSEFGLAVPSANGGLVNANDAPWAKTLSFMLYFHPDLKNLGAYYYRLSVVAADSSGNPQNGATPAPITNTVTWSYWAFINGQWEIQVQALGPNSKVVNGNTVSGLCQIPYAADALWLGGQYHQSVDTTQFSNGRYLLVLEVFDVSGNRLVPNGAPADAGDVPTAFNFLRMLSASGPGSTSKVQFAALTHLFWFDNRPVYGKIEDLDMNGIASSQECQFLSGPGNSLFQVGYRAFHAVMGDPAPDPIPPRTFMENYYVSWHEGLNGPSGMLDSGGDTNQPGTMFAGPNTKTPSQTFAALLSGQTACSFAVNLDVYSKHTDGTYHFDDYDVHTEAAFALQIV